MAGKPFALELERAFASFELGRRRLDCARESIAAAEPRRSEELGVMLLG